MKKIIIIIGMIMVLFLVGCTQVPPENPSLFGPRSNIEPYNCSINTSGFVYYNNNTHIPYICNSTNWTSMINTMVNVS
jgi:hypothetical protein